MIGKSTLLREFIKGVLLYDIINIKFFNPENPELTLQEKIDTVDWSISDNKLIIIENFEEALTWGGGKDQLHEIRFPKISSFLQEMVQYNTVKIILESRFRIKNNFLQKIVFSELSGKQLGKIERVELFQSLNSLYRNASTDYSDFTLLCDRLNDHVWLIELAMQEDWFFEDIKIAAKSPGSIMEQLWKKLLAVIDQLPYSQKILLSAFSIINPITKFNLENSIGTLDMFSGTEDLDTALLSLQKKLLIIHSSKNSSYEINSFLREVCFTFMRDQKEIKILDELPFFKNVSKPKYDGIIQAYRRNDLPLFFRLLKERRKKGDYEYVIEILEEAYWGHPRKEIFLNELAITYKWKNDYYNAIKLFNKLIEEYQHVPAYTELAIIYKEQGNVEEAINLLKEALVIDKNDVKTLNELGINYREQGRIDEAVQIFILLVKKYHIPAFDQLVSIYKEQEEYEEALRILQIAFDRNIQDKGLIHHKKEIEKIYYKQSARNDLPSLKAFIVSNLRRAILKTPENESDIQNVLEQIFIGKGLKKGIDYDKEVGRVKVSIKEFIPDFVFSEHIAIEVKFSKTKQKSKEIVDDINADISAYSKKYRDLLFIVYDMGTIIDENEFKHGIDNNENIQLCVIKH